NNGTTTRRREREGRGGDRFAAPCCPFDSSRDRQGHQPTLDFERVNGDHHRAVYIGYKPLPLDFTAGSALAEHVETRKNHCRSYTCVQITDSPFGPGRVDTTVNVFPSVETVRFVVLHSLPFFL